ncbi:hypothetical protein B7494_g3815 [Chlorociboria aeruginascens]|nr:hypothetical protein B7494_g3815 [Chlorociboria aeruginascens]
MLASRVGATAFAMVDDTMEISSEHGQNAGDEDIDIDIDITADQPDEDYILEDVDSNIGFGDHFQGQPSSVVGNDDPMIDAASSYEMDDVDFIEDQNNLAMEHAVAMSIVAAGVSNNVGEPTRTGIDPAADNLPKESNLMWEHPEDFEHNVDKSSLEGPTEESLVSSNDEDHTANSDTEKNADNVSNADVTQNNTGSNHSPIHGSTDPPRIESSENSTTLKIRPAEELPSYDHSNTGNTTERASSETDYETEPASLENHDSLLLAHKVVVLYRTIEYALFSKLESDDPDSFFISDLSIAEKPLDELFGAIRGVIHEDISDDDELSMSVEELGLEIDETSSSIKDVTFGQIIGLHSQLLRNSGVEAQRPIYIILSTRPNLPRRLAKLTAAAAEGKGLAELTRWDERSESPADAVVLVEDNHEDDSHEERYEPDDLAKDDTRADIAEATKTNETTQDDTEGFEPVTEECNIAHITATKNTPALEDPSNADTRQPPNLTTSNNREHDDDGDLIDYEDEEFEMLKKDAVERPVELKTNEAFEKKNEHRRRSISLAAEDDLESFDGQVEDMGNSYEAVEEAEDGAEFDDKNNEERRHDGEDTRAKELSAEDPSRRDQAGPNKILDTDGEMFGEEDGKNAELLLDEDELGLEDDGEPSGNADVSREELQAGRGQYYNLEDSDLTPGSADPEITDSTLGFLDASESSTVASEKTLEIQTSLDAADTKLSVEDDDEDEIGYDDDDEEQLLADSGHTVQEITISNGGPGKRSWADTDIEGSMRSNGLLLKLWSFNRDMIYWYLLGRVVCIRPDHYWWNPLSENCFMGMAFAGPALIRFELLTTIGLEPSTLLTTPQKLPLKNAQQFVWAYVMTGADGQMSGAFRGTSFVITKKGLMDAEQRHGFEGDGFTYLKSPIWWAGIIALIVGEIANFAAYAFAPAILVTPLGALSVLIGAVLGSYFLKEELGTLGKLGCAICLIGSVIIVLHAPPDQPIETIDQILYYAIQPAVFAVVMIYKVAPQYGKKNPLIYLSICSTVGSVSVMSVKAFGIAVKLTFAGSNQFTHPSTYVFIIVTCVCILTQMNYFNKALSQFPTSIVNPLYYVTFTTATLCASFILYGGFNTSDAVNTLSLLCGFLVIFTGVYLLNLSRGDPDGRKMINGAAHDGIATDIISGINTRRSMQARRSLDPHRLSMGSTGYGRGGDREGLIRAYDEEENTGLGLADLGEDSDEDTSPRNGNGTINGHKKSSSEPVGPEGLQSSSPR